MASLLFGNQPRLYLILSQQAVLASSPHGSYSFATRNLSTFGYLHTRQRAFILGLFLRRVGVLAGLRSISLSVRQTQISAFPAACSGGVQCRGSMWEAES